MDRQEYALKSIYATLPRTTRGMPLVIGGDPKGTNFLYCNGNSVVIRNLQNPEICELYTEHSTLTTVAKYTPSGFYIASGDQSGKIRIWDTTQKEHLLKKEYIPISGPIRDIAFSPDGQRVAVVGEGRERFGHVFLFDTGTSNGSLSGQSKVMSSVDFRPTKPMRIVTGSEDYTVGIYEGPPFKFKNHFQEHTRFVNCVRYHPSGNMFASAGADGKLLLFDGENGGVMGELNDPGCKQIAHAGGIYSICFTPDGSRLLSVSGDKTAKLWDSQTKQLISTFNLGKDVEDMQLGCLCQNEHMISISLAGFITYLDANNPSQPIRIVKGHNKPITAFAVNQEKNLGFTGDSEGNITRWKMSSGDNDRITPKAHKAQVQSVRLSDDKLVSVGMDDTYSSINAAMQTSLGVSQPLSVKLGSQPRDVSICKEGNMSAISCQKELCLFRDGKQVSQVPLNFESSCVALHPNLHTIAVGGQDSKVHIYNVGAGDTVNHVRELVHLGIITALKFSPDGTILAAADAARKVVPYKIDQDYGSAADKDWTFHTARVNCLDWCPDGRHLASGSLDTNVIVWDLLKSGDHPIIIRGAHPMSQITGVAWLSPNQLASAGQDSCVKIWDILF